MLSMGMNNLFLLSNRMARLFEYQAAIQRILFVGENLYTVSPGKIKVNDLKTLDEKGTLDIQ